MPLNTLILGKPTQIQQMHKHTFIQYATYVQLTYPGKLRVVTHLNVRYMHKTM